MLNYYRYLPLSDEDKEWGLSVLNAGCTSIKQHQSYPFKDHPSHHYFNWEKGRILDEFQVVYITAGQGVFESASMGETKIKEGSILLLFPGEWHRYKPDEVTGWDEYWVGFKGTIAETIFRQNFFSYKEAVLFIGLKEEMVALLSEIMEQTKREKPGYQPLVSGTVLHILGKIHAIRKQHEIQQENNGHEIINKAIVLLRTRMDEQIVMQNVALELQISYGWFRKMFKLYTGMAPQQYLIQLKIEKAKLLLNDLNKSVKEIAYELNFEYPLNFSKLFKEKVGLSPKQYRKKFVVVEGE